MARMQALRLMPSHTYFYKKRSEFGKDHTKHILEKVTNEGKRKTAIWRANQLPTMSQVLPFQRFVTVDFHNIVCLNLA